MTTEATTATTGAMPGAGAMPAQVGSAGTPPPPATGATPPASTTAPAAATPPATGDDPALGEAGNRVLREARRQAKEAEDRAKAAEAERDALKTATQTESERALADAVKAAKAEVTTSFEARIRRSEIRTALTAAGITATELDLASAAPEFASLKVTDDGVDGLAAAVATFKTGHPALFTQPVAAVGDVGSGPRGATNGKSLAAQIADAEAAGDIRLAISLKNRQLREQRKKE